MTAWQRYTHTHSSYGSYSINPQGFQPAHPTAEELQEKPLDACLVASVEWKSVEEAIRAVWTNPHKRCFVLCALWLQSQSCHHCYCIVASNCIDWKWHLHLKGLLPAGTWAHGNNLLISTSKVEKLRTYCTKLSIILAIMKLHITICSPMPPNPYAMDQEVPNSFKVCLAWILRSPNKICSQHCTLVGRQCLWCMRNAWVCLLQTNCSSWTAAASLQVAT